MAGRAYIGTSGWSYKHWRGCVFEPGLAQRRWLGRIAEIFDTVEVNTSFYRIPKRESVESWITTTPDHFLFALKLWRGITHYRKLLNAGDLTDRFLLSASAVPEHRRAPLLIQLPPNQKPDTDKLRHYIQDFRARAGAAWRIAVEFRHDDWLQPETRQALDELDAAVCLHDMRGKGATNQPNNAGFVYIRRHGSSEALYSGSYSPAALEHDAAQIAGWTRQGRDVYVYYNNDIGGHAFHNALDLRARLSGSSLT